MAQAQYLEKIESVRYSFREDWKEWPLLISKEDENKLKELASNHEEVSLKEFADNFSRETARYLIRRGVLLGPSPRKVSGALKRYYTFKKKMMIE